MHRAIETRYKGYRFRSRLEARWAVFFDSLGLRWEYEPEGYELGDGRRYLPDFFVRFEPGWDAEKRHPGAGYWVEVKPTAPTADEKDRLLQVVAFTKHHGSVVIGPPGENAPISVRVAKSSPDQKAAFEKLTSRLPPWSPFDSLVYADFINAVTKRQISHQDVAQACVAARSARFEFGESGARV
jgi:hypothetical protein